VLITPARNEERYIGYTLASMAAQTCPPRRWVIVSDASSDRTDAMVDEYRQRHDWITLLRMPERHDRSYAAKARCFNAGLAHVQDVPFDLVGCLDADVSFEPDFFQLLVGKFAENPALGVAGAPLVEGGRQYDYRFTNVEHVSGACLLFRRECLDAIGGYAAIPGGGIDWVAVTGARMRGWQTRTFTEKTYVHHRAMGTGSASQLGAIFKHGQEDYVLGGHPAWQLARCAYQMTRPPYVIRGLCLLAGYCWASLRRTERPISMELVRFHRAEQVKRLRRLLSRSVSGAGR
jgi:cellulose synthase/poly-beta-1,6-N-acetylglucosamine synthase-like glycosyltransferase